MRKKSTLISEITKIVLILPQLPLYFIKIIHEGADIDSVYGSSYVDYYFSIYDKIARKGLAFILWLALTISIASITMSVLRISGIDNKKIKIAGHILFGLAIITFPVLLVAAISINYKY